MGVTAITSVRNSTNVTWSISNLETPSDTSSNGAKAHSIEPGDVWQCAIWIPWADTQEQFDQGSSLGKGPAHIDVDTPWASIESVPPPRLFAVWQQGNYVRYSSEQRWSDNGPLVPGNSTVNGNRSMEIVGTDGQDADLRFY